jgi:hypothetical protein
MAAGQSLALEMRTANQQMLQEVVLIPARLFAFRTGADCGRMGVALPVRA